MSPKRVTDGTDTDDLRHNWHPFTQTREYTSNPRLHIVRGKGCWLYDAAGRRYLDGNASVWTNVHGHADPALDNALRAQLARLAHATYLGLNHETGTALARRLAELTGNKLPRVFYSDNGSGAVEIALKLSLQYWQLSGQPQRTGIIALRDAYHGDTFGTMSVGDSGTFHERFRHWFFPVGRIPRPRHEEVNGRILATDNGIPSINALDALLKRKADTTACLILEPGIQGSAGMCQHPPGFLRAIAQRCRRHKIHLILDEVFTGFGRLGTMLASRTENITPDFLCLAKGLTAGYLPLAATLTSERIHKKFSGNASQHRTFYHGHTYTGNPLASAVALKNIEKLDALLASGKLARTIATFGGCFERTFAPAHPHIAAVRQRGMTAAIELRPRSPRTAWPADLRAGYRVCMEARRRGLILRPLGDALLLVPPLVISRREIQFLMRTTLEAIDTVLPGLKA
jgi:adenosylmethionine-8-amino-7-oxononanoate aminotransferase